ncbi:MAG: hypothetical protein ACNA8G_09300 [Gammaproteobacteria bacterium]
MLKPQDILVLLKLQAKGAAPMSYNRLANELGMSPSEVHAAGKRALAAHLAIMKDGQLAPQRRNLEEFLLHGLRYVFPAERGGISRGMATGSAAPPLNRILSESNEPPTVWPDPEGELRGQALKPLYRAAPIAAGNDPALYELLALVDALRAGKARERQIAAQELRQRLKPESAHA